MQEAETQKRVEQLNALDKSINRRLRWCTDVINDPIMPDASSDLEINQPMSDEDRVYLLRQLTPIYQAVQHLERTCGYQINVIGDKADILLEQIVAEEEKRLSFCSSCGEKAKEGYVTITDINDFPLCQVCHGLTDPPVVQAYPGFRRP